MGKVEPTRRKQHEAYTVMVFFSEKNKSQISPHVNIPFVKTAGHKDEDGNMLSWNRLTDAGSGGGGGNMLEATFFTLCSVPSS